MRNMLEQKVNQYWYDASRSLPWFLLPFSPLESLYRYVSRQRIKQRKIYPVDANMDVPPIIVVGNITVGGTGKTPLLIALIQYYRQKGLRVGVVSRGYGGSVKQAVLVENGFTAYEVGDEPLMLFQKTGVPVAVCAKRQQAVELLSQTKNVDLIISDDGLQHYAMPRCIEVIVIDAIRGLGNQHQLPVGPLRESTQRIDLADCVVINGNTDPQLDQLAVPSYSMFMKLVSLQSMSEAKPKLLDCVEFSQHKPRVHAVAGIGHPERFFTSLRQAGFDVIGHPLADHHAITPDNLLFDDKLPVLITEKDAVKCQSFVSQLPSNVYSVQAEAVIDEAFFCQLDSLLQAIL